ncbi:MAG: sensor histidine kinase, partial [Deltaproteobacteria bacterium]|nr:sensor histidine kinase [Deltaproteobacteria bacterium]
ADIIANLLPMATAAHWSGGIYSPLLAVFVLKIGNYGLIYSVQVGVWSLIVTAILAAGLGVWGGSGSIVELPEVVRQQLTLAFGALLFIVGCIGALRFFRELGDRESRLAGALREQERLYQQSLRDQQHLRQLSKRMVQISESTMQRVSHELHDDLGQALTAVKMDLGRFDRDLPADSPLHGQIQETREQIAQVLQSVRTLSQLLRPAVLDDLGLIPAIRSYCSRFGERTSIPINLSLPPAETRLPQPIEVAVYRVLQESLTNVARHAAARRVDIQLTVDVSNARLTVEDDGCGFDTGQQLDAALENHGMGLLGMRERAEVYGGRLSIESQPRRGTRVTLSVPLAGAELVEESHVENQRVAS